MSPGRIILLAKSNSAVWNIHTQLQKKPISHFSGQLWKSELRNKNIFIPYSVEISSASWESMPILNGEQTEAVKDS